MYVDKKNIIIAVLLLIVVCLSWYLFGFVLPDNRGRTDDLRNELKSATERLNSIERGTATGAAEAGRISEGLGTTTNTIITVERRIETSQVRLGECQQIIDQVRKRGKTGD